MANIAANAKGLPSAVSLIRGPLLQRQVRLAHEVIISLVVCLWADLC